MNHQIQDTLRNVFNVYEIEGITIPAEIKQEIITNIANVLNEALFSTDSSVIEQWKNKTQKHQADTIVLGDVHGELRLLIQNLWLAGVVDHSGNYNQDTSKTTIQLGDLIDREGKYPFEVMLYMRALQNQAKACGGKVVLLFGNHEKFALTRQEWWNENRLLLKNGKEVVMRPYIRDILISDVTQGRVQLAYGDPKASFMCFHGRLSKEYLLQVISKMYDEPEFLKKMKQSNTLTFFAMIKDKTDHAKKDIKISLKEMYTNLERCGISLNDIANFMNHFLVRHIEKTNEIENLYLLRENEGVYGRKKKGDKDPLIPIEHREGKYAIKPIQFGGHTPTTSKYSGRSASGFGFGILQNRTTVYTDADLVKGFQAFVGINSQTGIVYAYELKNENGMIAVTRENATLFQIKDKIDVFQIRQLEGISVLRKTDMPIKQTNSFPME